MYLIKLGKGRLKILQYGFRRPLNVWGQPLNGLFLLLMDKHETSRGQYQSCRTRLFACCFKA
ncbi:hypothetical protein [Neisseria sicca]|uniref:hypothetical protein n=1 Tax=Neisseria sicca TaxID=490 RepID=UPI0011BCFC9F|nr:hypothetical protein [Neisseria sicca]